MATTPRVSALQSLARQMPIANQKVAQQLEAARTAQLQQTIAQAQPGLATTRPAQQLGAQTITQAGAQQAALQQQAQQQAVSLGQAGLAEQARQQRSSEAERARASALFAQDLSNRLGLASEQAKNELIDKQMSFRRDEAGRALLNERQLADIAILHAKDEVELRKYQQAAQQAWDRKLQVMKTASARLQQELQQDAARTQSRLSNEQTKQLTLAKQALDAKIARETADAENKMSMFRSGGKILGAVAGGVIGTFVVPGVGTAAGASIGATIGGGVGSMAGSRST